MASALFSVSTRGFDMAQISSSIDTTGHFDLRALRTDPDVPARRPPWRDSESVTSGRDSPTENATQFSLATRSGRALMTADTRFGSNLADATPGPEPSTVPAAEWEPSASCARFLHHRTGPATTFFLAPGKSTAIVAPSNFFKEGWLSPVEGTRLEIERGRNVTVGSNPTPSAMTFNRPPTLINKGSGLSRLVSQGPFLGQVSPKVSHLRIERQNLSKSGQKAVATIRLPINGLAWHSAKFLANPERDRTCSRNTACISAPIAPVAPFTLKTA
jgi:hypothetical protein